MEPNNIQREDLQLFLSIQKGDEKAFDHFFNKYYPMLCAYANQYVNFEIGEEIVQDIMIWLWEHKNFIVIETSPLTYLFKAVRNNCLKQIDKNETKNHILNILYADSQTPYDDPNFYIAEELTKKIEKSLQELPENYKEAFILNRFQGFTYQEIATRLNISPKTVDYRIQQALKILRIKLKDYLPLLLHLLS